MALTLAWTLFLLGLGHIAYGFVTFRAPLSASVAVHAIEINNMALLRLVGIYMSLISALGVCAYPKSPFLAGTVVSPLLLAASYGVI
jgi:hypothetical protein